MLHSPEPLKILFSSRPAYGHLYPLMPLAEAARDAGHEVSFATGPEFVPKLQALGFPTRIAGISIGQAEQVLLAGRDMPRSDDGQVSYDVAASMFIDIVAWHTATDLFVLLDELRPDLVVYEAYDFGAPVAAHAKGVPAVCHSISPQLPPELIERFGSGRLERLWAAYGMSSPPLDVFAGDAYLDIFPTRLQEPSFLASPERVPVRPVPWSEPTLPIPARVEGRARPLVYLTLGTVAATDAILRPAIDGLATLDADILVALGAAAGADLGPLPPNVELEPFVDQARLLAHVDLAVHHGGSGTTLGALVHGVPQVLLPKGADQFLNADKMATAGLAEVLTPAAVTPEAVATLARAALQGSDRPALDEVRDEIAAMPHPSEVVTQLVDRFCLAG